MHIARHRWSLASASALLAVGLAGAPAALAGDPPPPPPPMPLPQDGWAPGSPQGQPQSAFEDTPLVTEAGNDVPSAGATFTRDQLIELVGPVALYPDVVLASLLPATARPLDVVAAARHVRQSASAPGGTLEMPQGASSSSLPEWDPSVVGLLQFPDVLTWLDENLGWLEQMGAAMATQEAHVLDAIQEFRRRSREAGHLASDAHVVVRDEPAPEQPQIQVIVIEPAQPEICYIPVYDPIVVVQPVYLYPEPVFTWSLGFTFSHGSPWAWHSIGWGWWDWRSRLYRGGLHYHHAGYSWFGFGSSRDRYFGSGGTRWRSSFYSPRGSRGSAVARSGSSTYAPGSGGARAGRGGAYAPAGGSARVRSTTRPSWAANRGAPTLRASADVRRHTFAAGSGGGRSNAYTPRARVSRPAPDVGSQPTTAATDRPFARSFQDGRSGSGFQDGRQGSGFQDGRPRARFQDGRPSLSTQDGGRVGTPGTTSPRVVPTPNPSLRTAPTVGGETRSRFYEPGGRREWPRVRDASPQVAPVIPAPTPRVFEPRVAPVPRLAPTPRVYEPKVAPTPRVFEPRSAPTPRVFEPRVFEPRVAPAPRIAPTPRVVEPRVAPPPRIPEPRRARPERRDPTPSSPPPPPPPRRRRDR